jgi:hypothetical protein
MLLFQEPKIQFYHTGCRRLKNNEDLFYDICLYMKRNIIAISKMDDRIKLSNVKSVFVQFIF